MEKVRVLLEVPVAEKGPELRLDLPDDLSRDFLGDPIRLTPVLLNLAGNAVKFTHRGTTSVRVRVEAVSDREAKLGFEVTDTGIGIPSDRQPTLLDAFTQFDSPATRAQGGFGHADQYWA